MDSAELLSESSRAYIIAPAGCGKTHLIAEAIKQHAVRRELILTHTHAGVDVLRRRLRHFEAPANSFEIDTLAGWALRYACAFPQSSGQEVGQPCTDEEWKRTYQACSKLLLSPGIQEIVRASYAGVYVDEYQDCIVEQHELVCRLADILPCRILGDPLQGIFGFKNSKLVDWTQQVQSSFSKLPDLITPWRWKGTSPKLGDWLLAIREDLMAARPIDLTKAPKAEVLWLPMPATANGKWQTQTNALKVAAQNTGSVIAIMQWEAQCNKFVNSLSYLYSNIETMACDPLMDAAEDIGSAVGIARMDAVVAFASACLTGVSAETQTIVNVLRQQKAQSSKRYTRQAEMDLLQAVIEDNNLDHVLVALEGLRQIPKTRVWRRELFYAMLRSLREHSTGKHADLKTAAWEIRNSTRHAGRKLGQRIVSRTVLVKGLEFDHCVILDADSLTVKDLYVALTRGAKSLTILSKTQTLTPLSNAPQRF